MSEVPILIVLVMGLLGLAGIRVLMGRGVLPGRGKVPGLVWGTAVVLLVYVVFAQIVPISFIYLKDKPGPVPIPFTALAIYLVFAVVGVLVYVGTSEDRFREFMGPIERLLSGTGIWEKGSGPRARQVVLCVIPLAVGLLALQMALPKVASPTSLRIMHPTMPKTYEGLENPFEHPSDADLAAFTEEVKDGKWDFIVHPDFEAFAEKLKQGGSDPDLARAAYRRRIIHEGREDYMVFCRPCHGTKADGRGPMADGFRVAPADFTDEGTITTVTEGFAAWRIMKGGPALPPSGAPWDSAMPIWELDLGEGLPDQMWKIIMAEYDTAGVDPRKPEALHETAEKPDEKPK